MEIQHDSVAERPDFLDPKDGISYEDMEYYCRYADCSEFTEICARLSYSQLMRVEVELGFRVSRIEKQISTRDPRDDPQWSKKVGTALKILSYKHEVADNHLQSMRACNMNVLTSDIHNNVNIHGCTIVIKCLLSIINKNFTGNLTVEDKMVIDAARLIK